MEVIFCDNHILIAVKPAGLPTQPVDTGDDNFLDRAKAYIKKRFDKPGKVFLEPIHRLDKPVSGLVLFARTSKSLSRLQEMMRKREIGKTYFAWVEGIPENEGDLEHYLFHDAHKARVVSKDHAEAKLAQLHYRIVRIDKDKALLEIDLKTGRYHQIRVQLSAIGHPILGDKKYGSTHPWKENGIALHSGKLSFSHPVTKESLTFESAFTK